MIAILLVASLSTAWWYESTIRAFFDQRETANESVEIPELTFLGSPEGIGLEKLGMVSNSSKSLISEEMIR